MHSDRRRACSPLLRPRGAPSPDCPPEARGNAEYDGRMRDVGALGGGLHVDDGTGETATPSEPAERQSVAPENEELLKSQNEALYKEYYGGAWAHESPGVEVGGLVCRRPLQAQLTRLMRSGEGRSVWGDRMREQLLAELGEIARGHD